MSSATTHHPPPAAPAERVLLLAGIALAAFNLRTAVTSLTPLLERLGAEFSFGAGTAGVLGMLPSAAFALFGIATPVIARRIGLERAVMLAMGLAAAGLVLRSAADGIWVLLAGSAVALAGMGMGNVVLPPLVKRHFPHRIGAVSAIYMTMLQLGTILPALLAVPLAAATGWRISLGAWALVAVAAILPWLTVSWRWHRAPSLPESDGALPMPPTAGAQLRPWRTWLGWGMTLMFGMTSLMTYALFTWLPRLMTDAGASDAFGGNMVALFAALGLLGALLMPALAVRVRNPFLVVLGCVACQLGAAAGLVLAPLAAPLLWVGLAGVGGSTFSLSLTLINMRTRTPAGSAALSGFMQGVGYTVACIGPLLFGLLHEWSNGWAWPFALLVASALVTVFGAWHACKPRVLEDLAGPHPATSGKDACPVQT